MLAAARWWSIAIARRLQGPIACLGGKNSLAGDTVPSKHRASPLMPSEFDIHYALEHTHVLHEPDRRIDTFGSTQFEFQVVSELMDGVNTCRVREGKIEAHKPVILKPDLHAEFDFDGFGPQGAAFGDWLREHAPNLAFLKYGFRFLRTEITEQIVHESLDEVTGKLRGEVRRNGNPLLAIIQTVDDTWEVSLLKFTVEMIAKSQGINVFDFKRRGLL
jgi:hypothetical protein